MRATVWALLMALMACPAAAQEPESGAGSDSGSGSGLDSGAGSGSGLEPESESEEESEEDSESEEDEDDTEPLRMDVVVEAEAERAFSLGGSVHSVTEEELERFNYDDPLSVLVQVPGVYVRQEDGYGLRPNIGLRGATSERSRKITLMEDGVLIAPAAYSAPAAYYFPLITRMVGMDVYLGPAAILYGPHTIGGAIDMRSRGIPARREGRLDLALGANWFGRFHAHYGDSNSWGGFVAEVVHVRTSGFRHYDFNGRDGNTGFDRTDVHLRGELHGDLTDDIYHRLELTLGLGLEGSNESYLGLTEADLRADPWRRYGASSRDRMDWWRTRVMLRYQIEASDWDLTISAYRHDFDRVFSRMEAFEDGTSFSNVLASPTGRNEVYYDALTRGVDDPVLAPRFALLLARNHRTYASQGAQVAGNVRFTTGEFSHRIQAGGRLHYDHIDRDHTGTGWIVADQALVPDGEGERVLLQNHAQAWALSGYVAWGVTWNGLTLTPGVRGELVWTSQVDRNTGVRVEGFQQALLPGVGLQYAVVDPVVLFGGVHQGFSPVAPGQDPAVQPEVAWNYEVGARWGERDQVTHAQAAFFLSDYQNLTGDCSGAGGCGIDVLDRQFNGGRVTVLGVEAQAAHTFQVDETTFPLRLTYTFTWSRFTTGFRSDNPQWGDVEPGDHLPYVPEHQASAHAGFHWRILDLNLSGTFVSQMRDRAGHGPTPDNEFTDAYFNLDAVFTIEILPGLRVYARGENLTNTAPIVARRPFGARSMRPLQVQGGLQIDL